MKLIPVATICRFLGKSPNDSAHLIEAGLPVARIPGEKKATPRVVPTAFFRWMGERLGGTATADDVRRDFEGFLAAEAGKGHNENGQVSQ